jgi:hypothetical protein
MDFQGCIYYALDEMYCIILYERVLLYIYYSFEVTIVVNFNVSSTKDNAHAKLSRYV